MSATERPKRADTISSVSKRASPVRRSRHRPTEDLPAPIMPTRTMDFAVVTSDPGLRWPEHERLRRQVLDRYGKTLDLASIG